MNTREEWLNAALALTRTELYEHTDLRIPDTVRISCGFPGGGKARKAIGECWPSQASADQTVEIFISPIIAEPLIVLAALMHEGIHACGIMNHKADFKRAACAVGLEGKMTATTAGEHLNGIFQTWLEILGVYPHATLSRIARKKQSTRLIKCACPSCGYVVRTTAKWLEQSGAPWCACAADPDDTESSFTQMVAADSGEESDND